jgi:hypothetical protein
MADSEDNVRKGKTYEELMAKAKARVASSVGIHGVWRRVP